MRFLILIIFMFSVRPTQAKIDQNWIPYSKTYGKSFGDIPGEGKAGSVLPLGDGGAILAGYVWNPALKDNNRALVLRVNPSGEILWEKYVGDSNTSHTSVSVVGDLDKGFFVSGEVYSPGNFSSDFWYLHLSPEGDILTEKTYGGEGEETLRKAILTPDGDIYLVGSNIPAPVGSLPSHGWIVKIDSSGKKIWSQSIGPGQGIELHTASLASDGSLIVGGLSRRDFIRLQSQGYLAKISSDGTLRWEKSFGSNTHDIIRSVTVDEGGSLVFVGTKGAHQDFKGIGWLQKLDEDGHLLYERTFGLRGLNSIQNIPGKGYVVAGSSWRDGGENEDSLDAWIAVLNHNGIIEWEREVGGERKDEASEVIPSQQQGFYLCGATSSYSLPSQKLWLLKLDTLGRSSLKQLWKEELDMAMGIGSIEPLEKYIKSYPNSHLVPKARTLIYSLEERELALIAKNPRQDAYRTFLDNHPESQHKTRIKMYLKELEELEAAITSNQISDFKKFLENYPKSHFAPDIQKKVLSMEFNEAKKRASVIEMERVCSLTSDPRMLTKCDQEIYSYYKNLDKIEGFLTFIKRFPGSNFIKSARKRFHYLSYLKVMEGGIYQKFEFIEKIDDDRHKGLVLSAIFKEFEKTKSSVGLLGFSRRYPHTELGKIAFKRLKKQLFERAEASKSILNLERFQALFPHSEQFADAQRIAYILEEAQLLETANAKSKKNLDFFENIAHQNNRLANLALEWKEPWISVRKWSLMREVYPYSMTRQVQQIKTLAPFKFTAPRTDLDVEKQIVALDMGLQRTLDSIDTHQRALGELIGLEKELKICTSNELWLCEEDLPWMKQLNTRWRTIKKRLPIRQARREWLSNRQPEQPLEMPH